MLVSEPDNGSFAIDKTVQNDTGSDWVQFILELGTGSGGSFVPSAPSDGLGFVPTNDTREETGAFPNLLLSEDRIVFTGFLANGGTARFIVFISTDTQTEHTITLRQTALNRQAAAAPALHPSALALLALLLGCLAFLQLRRG